MGRILEALLDEAVAEVTLRDPGYLDRHGVGFADPADPVAEQFAQRGVSVEASAAQPLLARMLIDSAADAAAAEAGSLPLAPTPRRSLETLHASYDQRSLGEIEYLVRRGGDRWLVLINAVGIPLTVWSRLIADPDHDHRILVVQAAGGSLLDGGMTSDAGLDADVDRIEQVLDAEGIDRFSVLGWCSGGRTGVELAARRGAQVEALVLAAASFRGPGTGNSRPSQFEEDIGAVFDSVQRNPASADFLSSMLVRSQGAAPGPVEDAMLFRLPHQDHAAALVAPFGSGEALRAYAARLASDRQHDVRAALARVQAPIHAITGAHDHILDNAATLALLRTQPAPVSAVEIAGAGHYAHDLQYPYFRMLLDDALTGRPASAAARVRAV
jgi:pimeloyl-ACP methyl ester carboxylesterase